MERAFGTRYTEKLAKDGGPEFLCDTNQLCMLLELCRSGQWFRGLVRKLDGRLCETLLSAGIFITLQELIK